jgi:hypothetical protein
VRRFHDLDKRNLAAIAGLATAVTLLTACSQPGATGWQTAAPVTSSHGGASTSLPQPGGPGVGSNANLDGAGVVGAGSFPRSFLIPGTDTSISIGG